MICEKCLHESDPTTDDRRACSIAHCDTCEVDCWSCMADKKEDSFL